MQEDGMSAGHDPVLPLLTPAQAADQVGKTADWMRKRAGRGSLPHHKLGRHTRFCATCLQEVAAQTYRPAEGSPTKTTAQTTPKAAPRATAKRYQRRPRYPRAVS